MTQKEQEKLIEIMNCLPKGKVNDVIDFAEFVLVKHENRGNPKKEEKPKNGKMTDRQKYEWWLDKFRKAFNKDVKFKDADYRRFRNLLKEGYHGNDFLAVIKGLVNDAYHKENGYYYCIPKFALRDNIIERYASMKDVKKESKGDSEALELRRINENNNDPNQPHFKSMKEYNDWKQQQLSNLTKTAK
jgi:hypothetical protein